MCRNDFHRSAYYWNAVVRGMISNSTEGPDTAGNIAALNIIH